MKAHRSKASQVAEQVPFKRVRKHPSPLVVRKSYLPFGQPNFTSKEIAAVTKVLRSGWVGMGSETLVFEKELAAFLDVPHVVTVNSCTSALFLSLLTAGVGPGDEVICPSMTWCSTANAALYLGAVPVFADIDAGTWSVTPETIREKLTEKTKAVVVVHFGGLAVDIEAIRQAIPAGTVIIEDAAHAFGSRFANGRHVGTSRNLTCFSFYANKNLSTGEGGAVALYDDEHADRIRSLRQHGLPLDAWRRFTNPQTLLTNELVHLGYKMNYTDLQAAIGRAQLSRINEMAEIRAQVAECYVEALREMVPAVRWQKGCTDPYHARHLFVVQLPLERLSGSRDDVVLALRARNIGAAIHYAPLHRMPLYCGQSRPPALPFTEAVAQSALTLPISGNMTLRDADYVAGQFMSILEGFRKT
jgi:UDP-4-amino-4-deoxy-L-arabinose-oxoglutarate aminotransferase